MRYFLQIAHTERIEAPHNSFGIGYFRIGLGLRILDLLDFLLSLLIDIMPDQLTLGLKHPILQRIKCFLEDPIPETLVFPLIRPVTHLVLHFGEDLCAGLFDSLVDVGVLGLPPNALDFVVAPAFDGFFPH